MRLSTFIFALVVAGLVAVAYFDFQRGEEKDLVEENKNRIFPEHKLNRVVFYNGLQTIEFQAESNGWKILQPRFDEGDDKKINEFLVELLRQKAHLVSIPGPIPWSQYGLDPPQGYFLVKTKKGKEYRVDISRDKSFNGRYYLRKQDQLFVGYQQWGAWMKMTFDDFKKEDNDRN